MIELLELAYSFDATNIMTLKRLTLILLFFLTACGSSGNDSPPVVTSTTNFLVTFTGNNGDALPPDWISVVESSVNADIQSNQARLQTDSVMKVARVVNRELQMTDFEAKITIRFDDYLNQGIGFYGRQNGGYLQAISPNGQGYAVFIEGFLRREIGIWEEIDGIEGIVAATQDPRGNPAGIGNILNDTNYSVRFRVEQIDSLQTQVRSKIWLQTETEPADWSVEYISSTAVLQNLTGGFALDIYNNSGNGSIYFDDIEITNLSP